MISMMCLAAWGPAEARTGRQTAPDGCAGFTGATGEVRLHDPRPGSLPRRPGAEVHVPAGRPRRSTSSRRTARTSSATWRASRASTPGPTTPRRGSRRSTPATTSSRRCSRRSPATSSCSPATTPARPSYIRASVAAGLNVLADKPMAIRPGDFEVLKEAYRIAGEKGVLLYDIMTERFEITSILQKRLSQVPALFGELVPGTPGGAGGLQGERPPLLQDRVRQPLQPPRVVLRRPPAGRGHRRRHHPPRGPHPLAGLPRAGPRLRDGRRGALGPPLAHRADPGAVRARDRPRELPRLPDGRRGPRRRCSTVYANGEIVYRVRGIHAKVAVEWRYEAPEGTGDTHHSVMRGSKAHLSVRQGEAEGYMPTLYVEPAAGERPRGRRVGPSRGWSPSWAKSIPAWRSRGVPRAGRWSSPTSTAWGTRPTSHR